MDIIQNTVASFVSLVPVTLAQSLILAFVVLGIMIPFRMLSFPDLTSEGAFPLGGCVCGVLMAASNLVFILQARAGHDLGVLAFVIAVENVTTGMGTTAFVAYLSSLCNVAYTATQYALLTSLMAFSRTAMSSGAGWLADRVDWPTFFWISTIAALPGLLLLVWMIRRLPPRTADFA